MKLHIIIDFMHIYYKYFFQLKEGKLKHLSAPVDWNGTMIDKDVSLIYYPLRDIEGIRRKLESNNHDVTMSICFDMPSKRISIDGGEEYKSGRKKNLQEEDFKNIEFLRDMLKTAGHNVYLYEGYEADDIVNYLVRHYSSSGDFEYTVIYTNDKDLLININDKVGVMRFKQYKGYESVDIKNYESYLEREYKVHIPYNTLGLFLSTVGDSADKVKGIKGFGKKAFSVLISKLERNNDFEKYGDYDYLQGVVERCKEYLTDEQFKQLKVAYNLVANLELIDDIAAPTNKSTQEKREEAYLKYNMVTLVQ